jgi:hypothetical protein
MDNHWQDEFIYDLFLIFCLVPCTYNASRLSATDQVGWYCGNSLYLCSRGTHFIFKPDYQQSWLSFCGFPQLIQTNAGVVPSKSSHAFHRIWHSWNSMPSLALRAIHHPLQWFTRDISSWIKLEKQEADDLSLSGLEVKNVCILAFTPSGVFMVWFGVVWCGAQA